MPVSYSLWDAQTGNPGVVEATVPPVLHFSGFSADLGWRSLVCSDEDQGHPCSMPEVAQDSQELFYNKNWMDDLLLCLFLFISL